MFELVVLYFNTGTNNKWVWCCEGASTSFHIQHKLFAVTNSIILWLPGARPEFEDHYIWCATIPASAQEAGACKQTQRQWTPANGSHMDFRSVSSIPGCDAFWFQKNQADIKNMSSSMVLLWMSSSTHVALLCRLNLTLLMIQTDVGWSEVVLLEWTITMYDV
jgi:hypothetical protein